MGKVNYFKSCGISKNCFLYSFLVASGSFFTHVCQSVYRWNANRPSVNLQNSLCDASACQYFALCVPATWLLCILNFIFWTQDVCQALLQISFPMLWPGNSLWAVSWGNCRAHFISASLPFPSAEQGSLFCTAYCPMAENHSFMYFVFFFILLSTFSFKHK